MAIGSNRGVILAADGIEIYQLTGFESAGLRQASVVLFWVLAVYGSFVVHIVCGRADSKGIKGRPWSMESANPSASSSHPKCRVSVAEYSPRWPLGMDMVPI